MRVRSDEIVEELLKAKEKYPEGQLALLPALYVAHKRLGWLSEDTLSLVAQTLSVPRTAVRSVASFYAMFRNKPMGRHLIQICTNLACMITGSEGIVDILRERYGIEPGETTGDERFSLVIVECIGACGTAPAMLVNDDLYESLTGERVIDILEQYR
jgi:NADH-quinone oxidoreductase E subunit